MSEFAITGDKTPATEQLPFWKREEPSVNSQTTGAFMAFNSAFDVAAGRESYKSA